MCNEHYDSFILENRATSAEDNDCDDMLATQRMEGRTFVLWKISAQVSFWLLQIPHRMLWRRPGRLSENSASNFPCYVME